MLNISAWPYGLIIGLFLYGAESLKSQEADTTVWFPALSIQDHHLIGAEADTIPLDAFRSSMSSFSDILRREANVYFRDFGPGSSATVSLSGSRSNEVALIWNGIKISNPMLGVSDYSLVSSAGLTGLRLARPGNATIFGAGSSAGAIILEQGINKSEQPWELSAGWSTLQRVQLQGSYRLQKGRWKSQTSIEGMTGRNNYKHRTLSGSRERLPHARSRHGNLSHHSVIDLSPNQELSISVWARDHFREIPPILTEVKSEADQSDRFLRTLLQFQHLQSRHKWHLKAYYGVQNQIYRNPLIDLHANHNFHHFQGRMDNQWSLHHSIILKYGARTSLFTSRSDNYQGRKEQNRWALYSQLMYKLPETPLEFTVLLQPEWVTGLDNGTSPGWTMEAKIKFANAQWGHWSTFLNQNMVWPTLNDLHWNPGGNPDLRPEQNHMAGVSWAKDWPGQFTHSISYYFKWGRNWIQWMPSDLGFWRPFNAIEGSTHGINMELSRSWGKRFELSGGYQFVHTVTKDEKVKYKQSIYSPQHMWSIRAQTEIVDRWSFGITGEYTSTRFVTKDHSQALDPYFLIHAALRYQFANPSWSLGVEITNLLNEDYQGIVNRPMPGRQIQLNTHIKL